MTKTLTGNTAGADTSGSSAWFEPNVPLVSLTFVFTQRSGFPVYQTWFASLARDITGTVIADTGMPGSATVTLLDDDGSIVATTSSASDGSYSFTGVQASSGYTVSIAPPTGMITVGPSSQSVDLSSSDAVADSISARSCPSQSAAPSGTRAAARCQARRSSSPLASRRPLGQTVAISSTPPRSATTLCA